MTGPILGTIMAVMMAMTTKVSTISTMREAPPGVVSAHV